MPSFRARVTVTIRPSILDPQGRAVEESLHRLGHAGVSQVRVGKHIELTLTGERAEVEATLHDIAKSVLSNPVMEDASVSLSELDDDLERT